MLLLPQAVELCLRSGARISTQQHDLSTPVHLACAQGAADIVRLMFSMQPGEKAQCLASCDAQKMTPLHCAAMFDHPDIVEYLVKEVRRGGGLGKGGRLRVGGGSRAGAGLSKQEKDCS